ncbi:MAG: hypothetical protein PF904_13650 [Kiritimatiellae bacterium]|jgi:hypothetical protein|nr:hypothetical protein [Kiritimatiellia bacterium]
MTENIAKLFEKEIHNSFDQFLTEYGFSQTNSITGEKDFCVTYRNKEQYILIGGTMKPEDYPFYIYITFGEGTDEPPEADWNSAPFWRIMQCVSPEDHKKYLHVFEIPSGVKQEQITDQMWTCRELCKVCGKEFLEGYLSIFRFARTEQNKDRQPHKIYKLDSEGKYQTTYANEVLELKKKFS